MDSVVGMQDSKENELNEESIDVSKLIKSSQESIDCITNNKCCNPMNETLDIMSNLGKIGSIFEPTMGLIKDVLLLIKEVINIYHGEFNEEKESSDQHFLTLMGIAMNDKDLSTARSGLEELMEKIQAQTHDLITKQKLSEKATSSISPISLSKNSSNDGTDTDEQQKNKNWFTKNVMNKITDNEIIQNVLNISQIKKDRENWLKSCKFVYDKYNLVSVNIRENLQKCVDTIYSSSTTLKIENAKKIVDQIYQFIFLIYFRYIVYMIISYFFGDGPCTEDIDKGYLFENKNTMIDELNSSNIKLLNRLNFLWRPKLENRIIVTLFYHNKSSFMAIKCLQTFDENIVFANPENDLCPFWDYKNAMSPYFRLYCKKWPSDEYCIGVDKSYELEAKSVNNNLSLKRIIDQYDKNAFGRYRIHSFYKDSKGTKILNIYFNKKSPEATDYLTLSSTTNDEWEFIIIKIFDINGDYYYISPYCTPHRYIYMRSTSSGAITSYNGVENRPTEQSKWLWKPGTVNNSFI